MQPENISPDPSTVPPSGAPPSYTPTPAQPATPDSSPVPPQVVQPTGSQPPSYSPTPVSGQPTGYPPVAGSVQPPSGPAYGSGGKSGLFKVLMAMGALVVLALIVVGVLALAHKSGSTNTTSGQSPSSASKTKNAVVAQQLSDYDNLCKGGTVSNATAYQGGASPHPIVLFDPDTINKGTYIESTVAYKMPQGWIADYKNPASAQLVGCMDIKSQSSSTQTCSLQSGGKTVNLPLYPVTYKLTIYEAKTGKVLGTGSIPGPAASCPSLASYDPSNPKLYGPPDAGNVQQAITGYVTSK